MIVTTMSTRATDRDRAVAAIGHHLAEAILLAVETAQATHITQDRSESDSPRAQPPTSQRSPGALLTVEDVAEKLGVSVQTIYRWRTLRPACAPAAFKVGKYPRWKPEVVEAWISQQV